MNKEQNTSLGQIFLDKFIFIAYLLGKYCYGFEIDDRGSGKKNREINKHVRPTPLFSPKKSVVV